MLRHCMQPDRPKAHTQAPKRAAQADTASAVLGRRPQRPRPDAEKITRDWSALARKRGHCVKRGPAPALTRVQLLGERVAPAALPLVRDVERPGGDGAGGGRATVEHAAPVGTSQLSEESSEHTALRSRVPAGPVC